MTESNNLFEAEGLKNVLHVLGNRTHFTAAETHNILNASISHLYLKSNDDEQLISKVLSSLDKSTCYNFFTGPYGNSSLFKYLSYHEEIEGYFLNKPLNSTLVKHYSDNNLPEKMVDYLINLYENNNEPKTYLDINLFVSGINSVGWKKLIKKHPQVVKDWDITYHMVPGNILQTSAKFNTQLYEGMIEDYPHLSIYDNYGKDFIFNIGLADYRNGWEPLFKKEINKLTSEEITKLIEVGNISTKFQKLIFMENLMERKEFSNFKFSECRFLEQTLLTHFDSIWDNTNIMSKHKSTYIKALQETSNASFIETSIYFALSINGQLRNNPNKRDENKTFSLVKEILDIVEKNKSVSADLLEIFDERDQNPEFWLNKNGIADLILNSPTIKVKSDINEIEKFRGMLGYFHNIFLEKSHTSQITETIETFNKLSKKLIDEQGIGITYSYQTQSDYDKIFVYSNKNSTSKVLFSITDLESLAPHISQMNNFAFNELFHKNKIFEWKDDHTRYLSNSTEQTKEKVADIILDKAKNNGTFREYENIKLAGYNFFQLLKLYTTDTLFNKGKLKEIVDEFPFTMTEMINCDEANSFLFHHVDKDLTIYGLENNSDLILKNIIDSLATGYLSEISHKYTNTGFKYEKDDSLLHKAIQSGMSIPVIELLDSYPLLNSEINKSKKVPLEAVLAKIKVCSKKDKLDVYGAMFNRLLNISIDVPIPHLLKIYQECSNQNDKLIKYAPNWETIMNKQMLNRKVKDLENTEEVEETSNNDWKI